MTGDTWQDLITAGEVVKATCSVSVDGIKPAAYRSDPGVGAEMAGCFVCRAVAGLEQHAGRGVRTPGIEVRSWARGCASSILSMSGGIVSRCWRTDFPTVGELGHDLGGVGVGHAHGLLW